MPTRPKFTISDPSEASASFEAARIAQIHLLAMHSNPLLHAQFPTRKSQHALECFLARNTLQMMSALQTSTHRDEGIWAARLEGEDEIAGFIRWEYPSPSVGGAGSLLTRRLLELVEDAQDEDGPLPVYLESTMEAVPMYERLGFQACGWV